MCVKDLAGMESQHDPITVDYVVVGGKNCVYVGFPFLVNFFFFSGFPTDLLMLHHIMLVLALKKPEFVRRITNVLLDLEYVLIVNQFFFHRPGPLHRRFLQQLRCL